jgi:hypothetical protein
MLHRWTCSRRRLNEALSSRNDRCAVSGCGCGGGDDDRHPCFLTEREALAYMADRLRRIAVFER